MGRQGFREFDLHEFANIGVCRRYLELANKKMLFSNLPAGAPERRADRSTCLNQSVFAGVWLSCLTREINDSVGASDFSAVRSAVQARNSSAIGALEHVDAITPKSPFYSIAVEPRVTCRARGQAANGSNEKQYAVKGASIIAIKNSEIGGIIHVNSYSSILTFASSWLSAINELVIRQACSALCNSLSAFSGLSCGGIESVALTMKVVNRN